MTACFTGIPLFSVQVHQAVNESVFNQGSSVFSPGSPGGE